MSSTSCGGSSSSTRRHRPRTDTRPSAATSPESSSWLGPPTGPRRLAGLCRRRPRSARLACGVPRRTTANDPTWVEAVPTLVMPPPPSRRDEVVDTLHGVEVADPYRWLEDGESDEVQQWVAAQNRHTRQAARLPTRSEHVARTPDRADGAPGRARGRGPRRRRRDDGTACRGAAGVARRAVRRRCRRRAARARRPGCRRRRRGGCDRLVLRLARRLARRLRRQRGRHREQCAAGRSAPPTRPTSAT